MKKRGISALLVLVLALSLLPVTALAGTTFIHIDEERFPDENFRKYVEQFDVTGDEGVKDGYLSLSEREAVKKMEVQSKEIFFLKGVEYFPNLTYLNCNDNCIQELDLSQNPALVELCCSYNPLFTLNISRNLALKELSCADCKLTQLDISHNTKLVYLACDRNSLTELDTSKNPALKELLCAMNKLTKLDISKNKQLDYLYAYQNKLTKLDISNNKKMKFQAIKIKNLSKFVHFK